MFEIRPFARHDRDGLISLVNRHIAAAMPGGSVPISALLSQMERDNAEYVVEPWVVDRHTLVGIERDRVVAAVHMKRFGTDVRVSASYRDAAAIDWIVFDPEFPDAGSAALAGAIEHLRGWNARIWYADGNLPCLGVYGVPDAWPHVQEVLASGGFDDRGGQIEITFAGSLLDIDPPSTVPIPDLELCRVVGPLGTSFEARLDGVRIGLFETQDTHGIANSQMSRWADECNHWVSEVNRPGFDGGSLVWFLPVGLSEPGDSSGASCHPKRPRRCAGF